MSHDVKCTTEPRACKRPDLPDLQSCMRHCSQDVAARDEAAFPNCQCHMADPMSYPSDTVTKSPHVPRIPVRPGFFRHRRSGRCSARFGDAGSNTFGHIAEACAAGPATATGCARDRSTIPNMLSLGLAPRRRSRIRIQVRRATASVAALVLSRRRAGSVERQGYAFRTLGNRSRSGALRMGLFPADRPAFPAELTEAISRRRQRSGHPGQLPCVGNRNHRAARRGARQDRQADLLHIGRFRHPDRRA